MLRSAALYAALITAPFVHSDYTECTLKHNGPIESKKPAEQFVRQPDEALTFDPRTINDQWAPRKFDRETTVKIRFVTSFAELDRLCGAAPPPYQRGGCTHHDTDGVLITLPYPSIMPNPAVYAQMVDHELGHANGWNATHDN